MGHDSERAALIYLHSSRERQRALTDAVGEAARAELAKSRPREASELEGTRRARALPPSGATKSFGGHEKSQPEFSPSIGVSPLPYTSMQVHQRTNKHSEPDCQFGL